METLCSIGIHYLGIPTWFKASEYNLLEFSRLDSSKYDRERSTRKIKIWKGQPSITDYIHEMVFPCKGHLWSKTDYKLQSNLMILPETKQSLDAPKAQQLQLNYTKAWKKITELETVVHSLYIHKINPSPNGAEEK